MPAEADIATASFYSFVFAILCGQFIQVRIHNLGTVQFHDNLRAIDRDLLMIPLTGWLQKTTPGRLKLVERAVVLRFLQLRILWMAVIQDERESIKSLVQYGANCELDQKLAMQVLDYALAFDIPEVVEISLDQCLTADYSFTGSVPGIWVADYYGSELSKMLLINEGADPREKPGWVFKNANDSINDLLTLENFFVKFPKRLREKYGDLVVGIDAVVDPYGRVRFPKSREKLPWDLSIFLRESIRKWRVDLNNTDQPNTAYNVSISLMLRSDDYGVKVFEIVEVDEAPVVTKTEVPKYPPILKSNRIQGNVSVVFTVDPKGNVREVEMSGRWKSSRPRIEDLTNQPLTLLNYGSSSQV